MRRNIAKALAMCGTLGAAAWVLRSVRTATTRRVVVTVHDHCDCTAEDHLYDHDDCTCEQVEVPNLGDADVTVIVTENPECPIHRQ